jgi:methylmalonyl-CoA mutase cobalamin-binding subunit
VTDAAPEQPRPLLYLSGPISGIEGHNRGAFRAAAQRLADGGFDVISPVELGPGHAAAGRAVGVVRSAGRAVDAGAAGAVRAAG